MAVGNKYLSGVLAFGKGAKGDKMIAYAAIALGAILVVYFLVGTSGNAKGGAKGKKITPKASPAKATNGKSPTSKRNSRSKSPAPRAESPAPEGVKRSARLRSRTPKKK
jgi:hypothetical protein